jgi:prophage antirepressor-like protein
MENDIALTIFNYGDVEVRTVIIDETPFGVAKEVATALGCQRHSERNKKQYCKGVVKYHPLAKGRRNADNSHDYRSGLLSPDCKITIRHCR